MLLSFLRANSVSYTFSVALRHLDPLSQLNSPMITFVHLLSCQKSSFVSLKLFIKSVFNSFMCWNFLYFGECSFESALQQATQQNNITDYKMIGACIKEALSMLIRFVPICSTSLNLCLNKFLSHQQLQALLCSASQCRNSYKLYSDWCIQKAEQENLGIHIKSL